MLVRLLDCLMFRGHDTFVSEIAVGSNFGLLSKRFVTIYRASLKVAFADPGVKLRNTIT